MKRNLQKLLVVFAALFVSFSLFAQQFGRPLNEGFENGIPSNWTQEVVSGDLSWSVESGDLTYPNGAYSGTHRVALRGVSGVTTNACVRLVSPVMDISKIYRPLLIFAHAQDHWTKDVDKLRVLYRLSADADWVELKVYDEKITFWQVDTLKLVGSSKTYQIAFEATDRLGRGVVIDNVEVRSTPRCDTPYALMISEMTSKSAVVNWLGAFDATGFNFKLTTETLTLEQLNDEEHKANVMDTILPADWSYKLTNLVSGTKYYYYMRSICEHEVSDWVVDSFEVSYMLDIPYVNDFNMPTTAGGLLSYPEQWVCESSVTSAKPFVNTCKNDKRWYNSIDSTYALCFFGNDEVAASAIEGGAYSYVVLPEARIDDVSKLAVSFTTINYEPHLSTRFSLIVGVMTDPLDKVTFVPVDTIDITSKRTYEECFVSLENYDGNGKYITFMSDFVESNIFCMDNLKIDYIPEINKVSDFNISILSSSSVRLDFALEYPKYDIVASTVKLANVDEATNVIKTQIANGGVVTGLEPSTEYYIYARAVKGDAKGEWSIARIMRTPGKVDVLPYTETFTLNSASKYYFLKYGDVEYFPKVKMAQGMLSLSSGAYPMICDDATCSDEAQTGGSGGITLKPEESLNPDDPQKHLHIALGDGDFDLWSATVMPELSTNIRSVSLSFTAYTSHEEHAGAVIVGVMKVANDISTFQPVDTIELKRKDDKGSKKYICNFDEYEVEGQFIAFKVDSKLVSTEKNVVCIDDVRFSYIPTCKTPSNVEVVSIPNDPTQMTLTWQANGAQSWAVRLFEVEYKLTTEEVTNPQTGAVTVKRQWEPKLPHIDDMYSDSFEQTYVYNDTVTTNSVKFTNLRPSGNVYYYTIRPICPAESGNWTEFESFATNCPDEVPVPYIENFDNPGYAIGANVKGFAVPCMFSNQLSNSTGSLYTPSVNNAKYVSEYNSVILTVGGRFPSVTPYFALPKMAKPLQELQLSFKTLGVEGNPPLLVGVMSDPMDTATFDLVETIQPIVVEKKSETEPDEFLEYIVSFAKYKGNGSHIAIMLQKPVEESLVGYTATIDDVVVDNILPCARPEDVKLADRRDKSVQLSWEPAKDINQWRVVFATEKLSLQELANPSLNNVIAKIDTVTSSYTWFYGLTPDTEYYVYVQSMCSDVETSKWSNFLKISTLCTPISIEDNYVESFELDVTGKGTHPACYVVGSNVKSKDYIPYCDTKYKHTGKSSLHIVSSEEGNGAYVITNGLEVDDIANVKLNFWGWTDCPSNRYAHSIVVGVLTSPSNLATFVPVDTVTFSSTERQYEVHFHNYKCDYNGERGKFIMFFSEFDLPNDICIDDVSFAPASPCPTSFYFDEITHNSTLIRFTSDNGPYEVKYSTAACTESELDSADLATFIVEGNSLMVTNLSAYTTYYFYARSTCDGEFGDWSVVNVLRTNCYDKLPLPYFDNFDNQEILGQLPDCWHGFYKENNIAYPSLENKEALFSHLPHSGNRKVYLYTSTEVNSYLVTREIDVDNLSKCQVTLFAFPKAVNKNFSVVVGVVSDVFNIDSTFVPVDTIIINSSELVWKDYEVSLEKYKGNGKHIAFMSDYKLNETTSSSTGVYIDDVLIELIPACKKVKEFNFVGHSENSITLSFLNNGVGSYEAVCGAVGFDADKATDIVSFTDTVFTLSNLQPATYYDVYVRTVCSATNKSPWVYAGKYFTSGHLVREYPYLIDFEDESEASKWLFAQDNQMNKWFIGADTAAMVTDTVANAGNAMYVSLDGGVSAHYDETTSSRSWAYRAFHLEPGTYTVSFDWTCVGENSKVGTSTTYSDYIRAGFLPTTSTVKAGDYIVTDKDQTTARLISSSSTLPTGWIELVDEKALGVYILNGSNKSKPLADQWATQTTTFVVTEETAGDYNIVFQWINNNTKGDYASIRSAVIDNINVVKESCDMPYNVEIVEVGVHSVDLAWGVVSDTVQSYKVEVKPAKMSLTGGLKTVTEIVSTNSAKITGLVENTDYKVTVKALCSENNESLTSEPLNFTTYCLPFGVDSLLSFEDVAAHLYLPYTSSTSANTKFGTPKCFTVGHDTLAYSSSTYAKFYPNLIPSTSTKKYSRTGDYALMFERTSTYKTSPGGYIIFPDLEGERENLLLSFWMRCFNHNPKTGLPGSQDIKSLGNTYARKISVGTVLSPDAPETFELITVFEYPYTSEDITTKTNVEEDPNGNEYWVECKLPLVGTEGKYIAFRNDLYEDGLLNNIVYVDDIKLTSLECFKPDLVKVDSVTTTSAVINCAHSNVDKHIITLATDDKFTKGLRKDTVATFPVKLTELASSTVYYMQIQSICSTDKLSEKSDVVAFTTQKEVAYTESFSIKTNCPVDWKRANNIGVYDFVKNPSAFFVAESSNIGWRMNEAIFRHGLFSTTHMSVEVTCNSGKVEHQTKNMLLSPEVVLPNAENLHLIFDLALTDINSSTLGDENLLVTPSRFVIAISGDAGKTWQNANTIVWGGEKDTYKYFEIPSEGKKYSIDLSKFAGKVIRVAFFAESALDMNAATELHIDNVHINAYNSDKLNVTICETEDYLSGDLYVPYDELTVGENLFDEWVLSSAIGVNDIKKATKLVVSPIKETIIDYTICEGDVYDLNNFDALTKAGVYKQKLVSASGCDSVVTLNLSINKSSRVIVEDTICKGQQFVWNGKVYTEAGLYPDTLVNQIGCDSIVTLSLYVNDAIRVEESMNICYGASYIFGTKTITKSGVYTETFKSVDGCDSIVTLTATVLPEYNIIINDAIREGEKYAGEGFKGISRQGTYTLNLKSVDGCDSVVTLNLLVLKDETNYVEYEITTDDLPYSYYSINYDENTKPGTYTDTITVTVDGVDYVVVHTLIISLPSGLGAITVQDLVLAPNPVKASETLYVINDFSLEERNGLRFELFNSMGQCVYVGEPNAYPIAIEGMSQTGIYILRIVTGTGSVYQGKVLFE